MAERPRVQVSPDGIRLWWVESIKLEPASGALEGEAWQFAIAVTRIIQPTLRISEGCAPERTLSGCCYDSVRADGRWDV
jgi:hypothetical protein